MRLAIALLAASGCGGDCVEDVCANYDNAVVHPGPCKSVTKSASCTFAYDNDGNIMHAQCGTDEAAWTWTPATMPKTIDAGGATWTFGQQITVTGTTMRTYDPALFAFLPLVGDEVSRPTAELGLVRDGTTTYTWTVEPGQWTRQSSAGETKLFAVDDQHRVLAFDTFTYRYEGAHLVERDDGTHIDRYRYDRAGNVVTHELDGALEVFDYGCW